LANFGDIPNDPTNGFKTFRYTSFSTPATTETADNYLARNGRWPKNWQNFNPGPGDNRFSGSDATRLTFGPDNAFYTNSFGQASAGAFNPVQTPDYMRNQARAWLIWFKKQTGMDGWRVDAIKHFPNAISEDILWNLQNNAGFANGGNDMFAVGEWVGGAAEMDAWVDAVQGRAGTFDFQLHGYANSPGLVGLVYGMGNYDMSNLPGLQQARRDRTVPFVNNHDTFRPGMPATGSRGLDAAGNYPVDANGNPQGWQSTGELAPNVDPREPRIAVAYAVISALDGNPGAFFEDLFDIGESSPVCAEKHERFHLLVA
jgi:alpha-amylase